MRKYPRLPIALTIAGSDSGGGAGIQADLKTFAALGVHGTSSITCLTAQNPRRVLGIQACRPKMLESQLQAVGSELPPAAVKTGMLFSSSLIRCVADWYRKSPRPPLVVDPVMVATSGALLLERAAIKILVSELLPLASLITPNLREAEVLTGRKLRHVEDLRAAARVIHARSGSAALVKGGHLRGGREAIDFFYDGQIELMLTAPFIHGVSTHGTGCTYSAAITGYLALGFDLCRSVEKAKQFITQAIACSGIAASHDVLNQFWER
jgi:hydroxymethylpyrimidine/phosphomethylpyrimidine kinase